MSIRPAKDAPNVILLGGPNGAGKSTAAPALLRGCLAVDQFVNADQIARGLAEFAPESAAIAAGRILLARIKELAKARANFAFESTLASRSFAPWLRGLQVDGYEVQVIFLWLASPELAIARVADRVRAGGHDVPEAVIRRRYRSGIVNFWKLYRPLCRVWYVFDNSDASQMRLIAKGSADRVDSIRNATTWRQIETEATQ